MLPLIIFNKGQDALLPSLPLSLPPSLPAYLIFPNDNRCDRYTFIRSWHELQHRGLPSSLPQVVEASKQGPQ